MLVGRISIVGRYFEGLAYLEGNVQRESFAGVVQGNVRVGTVQRSKNIRIVQRDRNLKQSCGPVYANPGASDLARPLHFVFAGNFCASWYDRCEIEGIVYLGN